jgi:hypothetical protein
MRTDYAVRENFAKGTMPARNKKTSGLQRPEQV